MAQTNQIFKNRVLPQITGVNTAVFAQPIQSFKPLDLGDALESDKLELERQKLAIAAEKNRIDMEEAKARVALLEKNIREKRAADNRTYLNMLAKSMDVGDEDAKDPTISPDLRKKIIARNNEWNEFIVNATNGDTKLDQKAMQAEASKIFTAQANDTEYIQLKRLDNEMKSLVKRVQNNRAIDPTLLNDLTSAYINGQIPPTYKINEQSLMIDENYIKAKDKDLGNILRRYTTEEVEAKDMKGNRYKEIVWKNGLDPEVVYQIALEGIQSDRVLMGYLDNMARRDQLLSQGMYNSIPDREAYRNKLAQSYALSISSENAPKLDWSKVTNPISKKESIKNKPQAVGGNGQNITTIQLANDKEINRSKYGGEDDSASDAFIGINNETVKRELRDIGANTDDWGNLHDIVSKYTVKGDPAVRRSYDYGDYAMILTPKKGEKTPDIIIPSDKVQDEMRQLERGGKFVFNDPESKEGVTKDAMMNYMFYKQNNGQVYLISVPNPDGSTSHGYYVSDKVKGTPGEIVRRIEGKEKKGRKLVNNIDYVRLDATFDSNVKHFKSNKPKSPQNHKSNKSNKNPFLK